MLRKFFVLGAILSPVYAAEPVFASSLYEVTEIITVVGAIVNKDSRSNQNGIVVFKNAKSGKTIPVGIGRAFVIEGKLLSVLHVSGVEVTISDGVESVTIDSETNQILSRSEVPSSTPDAGANEYAQGDDAGYVDGEPHDHDSAPRAVQSSTLVDKEYVNPANDLVAKDPTQFGEEYSEQGDESYENSELSPMQ